MVACSKLIAERNIPEEDVQRINRIHESLELLFDTYTLDCDFKSTKALVQQANEALQKLWKFPVDPRYDSWTQQLQKKHFCLQWVGRKFKCKDTGMTAVITQEEAQEHNLVGVGKGFIDLGVVNGYHRIVGNIEELINED